MSRPLRIAISGGGIAGASLMHALLKFPHLDVHIFESAPAFKEAGMAVGLARNALSALDLIGPSAVQCLERAGAVPMRGVRFLIGRGAGQGGVLGEVDSATEGKRLTSIVHRAALLQELLADVPEERMHASKKLTKIEGEDDGDRSGPITLHFADGTTHECDILIGADGIHSTVRKLVLGEDDPAASPRNTGMWCIMTLQPYAEAEASIGKENISADDAREYSWVGPGAFLMHNVLSDGKLVQFVVAGRDPETSDRWQRTVSAKEIREIYRDWPAHLTKAIDELICKEPEQRAFYLWEHPPAHTYVSGPIGVVGDAAHATAPWQGSGGGMCLEDSLVLSTLLGHAKTPAEARAALRVYDEVRRPRTQRIVQSSRATGELLSDDDEKTLLELKKSGELLRRWDFILDIDLEKHRDEALRIMDQALRKTTA